jgi:Predicted transcriptional regulators
VSTSLKELQGWKLIRVAHVMGDRRDHFESIHDISELFRVIVEERKRRELDPTIAMLREIALDDPKTPAHVRQKLKSTLSFLEMLDRWYEEMKGLPHPLMLAVLRLGGRVQRFLKSEPG